MDYAPSSASVNPRRCEVPPRSESINSDRSEETLSGIVLFGYQQIFEHCEFPEERGNLECPHDSPLIQRVRWMSSNIDPIENYPSRFRLVDPADYVDESRLACAICSN